MEIYCAYLTGYTYFHMAENVCDHCQKPLEAGGSIVLTPEGESSEKHLCMSCFENLETPSKS